MKRQEATWRYGFAVMLALAMLLALGACGKKAQVEQRGSEAAVDEASASATEAVSPQTSEIDYSDPGAAYKLQQVVVLSRHNIRAPLSTNGSVLATATQHEWTNWTAEGSELTMRGGALETMNGQFFRGWLEHEGLIGKNWQPEDGQVRFYANGRQRTIATAQYFSSGMLPVANVGIETHVDLDVSDPVFSPVLTFMSEAYEEAALDQIAQMGGDDKMAGLASGLSDSYELIADVLDYTESEGYESGELKDFDTTDTGVVLEQGAEPAMTGSLKLACQLADALVLQYYEAPDAKSAAFGHDLTEEQWTTISKAKDVYGDILFTAPVVATNVAHPLLEEIGSELDADGRVFTFLCGHDSNVGSVLAALGVQDYELPDTIEKKTPIGCKLLFEKWADEDGALYGRVRLMYQSTDQLREGTMLSGHEAPLAVELSFDGLEKNADGLYAYDDLRAHLQKAADAYDDLVEAYGEIELAEAA